jgi:hypothetical protein
MLVELGLCFILGCLFNQYLNYRKSELRIPIDTDNLLSIELLRKQTNSDSYIHLVNKSLNVMKRVSGVYNSGGFVQVVTKEGIGDL